MLFGLLSLGDFGPQFGHQFGLLEGDGQVVGDLLDEVDFAPLPLAGGAALVDTE